MTSSVDPLRSRRVEAWIDIGAILDEIRAHEYAPRARSDAVAFVTFAYDVDGVSLEIAKYGEAFERLVAQRGEAGRIHCIGGNFRPGADNVLPDRWRRHRVPGMDGWAKWDGGRWFTRLFLEEMKDGGDLASEIWNQALALADALHEIIAREKIGLLFVVNVNSNPGNLALALAVVIVSELSGCPVLNNNHDFCWEGGEPGGPRAHFFRTRDNAPFFELFRRLLPWNGRRWIQVNINPIQSRRLVEQEGFEAGRVFGIGTAIADSFFEPTTSAERRDHRLRMAHILSDGSPVIRPLPLDEFLDAVPAWMTHQRPVACGAAPDLELDIASQDALYFLQTTRVIARKRIERDWELIGALLRHEPFRRRFEAEPAKTLTLHVTGPVPIEHRVDLERVLHAYREVLRAVPDAIAHRLFLAFSVGTEGHPALQESGLGRLDIAAIYKLADVVVFPSLTEGRGLPILESSAAGVPIVCSRYQPEEVFAAVVGEDRPESERILYETFPDGEFDEALLQAVTDMVFEPAAFLDRINHNREVVRRRFSMGELSRSLARFLEALREE
jgi:glycosyltransferase involved in cell wall biosynthesis